MPEKLKILIVEDEAIVAEDMRIMLSGYQYEISGMAFHYEEAVALLDELKPDLVLIDIHLGDEEKDGIQLAQYVRNTFGTPFLFVTSNADEFTIQKAKQCHPHGYVVKPFEKRELYAAIEIAMANISETPNDEPQEVLLKDALFIKHQGQFQKVLIKDIIWLKADGNYTDLHTDKNRFVVRGKVKEILSELNKNFIRIHKSYVVNLHFIESFNQDFVFLEQEKLPIGKTFRDSLLNKLKKLS